MNSNTTIKKAFYLKILRGNFNKFYHNPILLFFRAFFLLMFTNYLPSLPPLPSPIPIFFTPQLHTLKIIPPPLYKTQINPSFSVQTCFGKHTQKYSSLLEEVLFLFLLVFTLSFHLLNHYALIYMFSFYIILTSSLNTRYLIKIVIFCGKKIFFGYKHFFLIQILILFFISPGLFDNFTTFLHFYVLNLFNSFKTNLYMKKNKFSDLKIIPFKMPYPFGNRGNFSTQNQSFKGFRPPYGKTFEFSPLVLDCCFFGIIFKKILL